MTDAPPQSGDTPEEARLSFEEWFHRLTGTSPYPWQVALGDDGEPRSRMIRIPTGFGKTWGIVAAWSYHRVHRSDERWPRRLVWVLPMRVLVEQTREVVRDALERAGVLHTAPPRSPNKVGVHLVLGGAALDLDWNLYPEAPAVFVGTQDMLLSRALLRGYGAARARWPLEFGLLNHDALWVYDEVQLMDVGLATSAQLQAFFDDDGSKGLRPRYSWWMSATLQPEWLRTVDTACHHPFWIAQTTTLSPAERSTGLCATRKTLRCRDIAAEDVTAFAAACLEEHRRNAGGPFGRITLVVCNTVERARATYDELCKRQSRESALGGTELRLVHGRFRPCDRSRWRHEFLTRAACHNDACRLIVTTQVIEAGVDVTASVLVTELAPWSSLVQRFGRCARYGGTGTILVVDRGRDPKATLPYDEETLDAARWAIDALCKQNADAGIASLEQFENNLTCAQRQRLYRYEPDPLVIRRDFDELFDTTPDLTGSDIDVSRFIRSGEDRDVYVFWSELPRDQETKTRAGPTPERRPAPEELCPVPVHEVRRWLWPKRGERRDAWTWDWLDGAWRPLSEDRLVPGLVVCVPSDEGGYTPRLGFDPASREPVEVVRLALSADPQWADDLEDSEALSEAEEYKTIATHGREVADEVDRLARTLQLPQRLRELLVLAARWHDYGKAHPAFQAIIEDRGLHTARRDLAKAPSNAWQRPPRYQVGAADVRRGFRHELASCLGLFALLRLHQPDHPALLGPWRKLFALLGTDTPEPAVQSASPSTDLERDLLACTADEFDLVAYLVLAHHGKVRASLHAGPKDQEYVTDDDRGLPIRGVREGDELPSITLDGIHDLPAVKLTLSPAQLGLSPSTGRSWRERTLDLQRRWGPGALAWLEALLIAADRRASRLAT
ncbi:MAG: CRISPR-associated endonuclease Cas3'', partial [Myxococcota bacterium]|nr:CRISPR-associated endonuclease Cas3'' [Myxococcota bacterium]